MVISAFKCDSRYHFADSMKPFFALVALCISYLSSVGGAYGTRHRQYNYTFKIAVSHLTTSPVIVGNGVSFPTFRHPTRCGLIFFYHSFLSLDCYHMLDWQQTLWHKLHSRLRYLVAGWTQTVLSTAGQDSMRRMFLFQTIM